ncbi:MAG TPA: crossover junction endodeoxyribonuclease RuvC [Candidatus Binatia bacterium]|nr:crossover junction endodeoxyribonuclease RuvC [Candidatus Binatia bacterium]
MAPPRKTSARRFNREVILGIDPGSLVTGWGLVEVDSNQLHCRAHGTIVGSASSLADRLSQIYRNLQEIIERHHPTAVSLEKVFFSRNVQSALKLGQARGVALLAAAEHRIGVAEYSAAEIKVAVVGYGRATKEQVQKMVGALLCVRGAMRADAADALAAAICHIHRRTFQPTVIQSLSGRADKTSWRDCLELAAKR